MTFKKWVESYGAARLAKDLKVTRQSVYMWAWGKRVPTYKHKIQIGKISSKKIDWSVNA